MWLTFKLGVSILSSFFFPPFFFFFILFLYRVGTALKSGIQKYSFRVLWPGLTPLRFLPFPALLRNAWWRQAQRRVRIWKIEACREGGKVEIAFLPFVRCLTRLFPVRISTLRPLLFLHGHWSSINLWTTSIKVAVNFRDYLSFEIISCPTLVIHLIK